MDDLASRTARRSGPERDGQGYRRLDRTHRAGTASGRARPTDNQTRSVGPAASAGPRTLCGQPGDGQHHKPCMGGAVDPFHMESITAGSDCAVLRIDGDIDAYAAPQLRDRLTDLAGHGVVNIIADLRGAGFLDSA